MDKRKSEQIHDELNTLAAKLYHRDYICYYKTGIPIDLQDEDFLLNEFYDDFSDLKKLKYQFVKTFNELYEQSLQDNYLWQYCSIKVYKSHLEQIKNKFLKKYDCAIEEDFFNNEIENIFCNYQDLKEETYPYPFKGKTKSFVPSSYLYNIPKEKKYQVLYKLKEEKVRISYFLNEDITKKIKYTQDRKYELLVSAKLDAQSNHNNSKEPHINRPEKENPYYELFNNNNYELFMYLVNEYKRDNNALKAKYSNIYHFMEYENCISGTQRMYIDFIIKKFGESLSKIIPETYKYKDEIQPLLTRLKNQFEQNKQH